MQSQPLTVSWVLATPEVFKYSLQQVHSETRSVDKNTTEAINEGKCSLLILLLTGDERDRRSSAEATAPNKCWLYILIALREWKIVTAGALINQRSRSGCGGYTLENISSLQLQTGYWGKYLVFICVFPPTLPAVFHMGSAWIRMSKRLLADTSWMHSNGEDAVWVRLTSAMNLWSRSSAAAVTFLTVSSYLHLLRSQSVLSWLMPPWWQEVGCMCVWERETNSSLNTNRSNDAYCLCLVLPCVFLTFPMTPFRSEPPAQE